VQTTLAQEIVMIKFRSTFAAAIALPVLLTFAVSAAHGQRDAASSPPSGAEGNKAAKPPVEAAAAETGVVTKKPAKQGAQGGPATPEADTAAAAKGNKAGKPPVDDAAAKAGVATKKPAKSGTQSGPAPAASAP
jgi:hypothetical protein